MKTAVAISHVSFEGLDGFEPALEAAGYDVAYADATQALPETAETADLLVVLGGPIGAYEHEAYPFLKAELSVIEQRLAADRPLMGVCLGAQLIALAAGARVFPSGIKEIGFAPITLTEVGATSCLAPFQDDPVTLHWHGDTFDLPPGAAHLASTAHCENQAFALGANVIGFQFHPEATGRDIGRWLVGHTVELAAAGVDVKQVRADAARHHVALERKAEAIATAWLAQLDL